MARETKRRIRQREQVEIAGADVRSQVVARPVNQTVTPERDWEMIGLVEGLSQINPALKQAHAAYDRSELEAGMTARQTGAGAPEDASSRFMHGYELVDGQVKGAADIEALRAKMNTEFDWENGDLESFISQQHAELTKGLDGASRTGYDSAFASGAAVLRKEFYARQRQIVEDTHIANATARTTEALKWTFQGPMENADPEVRLNMRLQEIDLLRSEFAATGITGRKFNEILWTSVDSLGQEDPEAYEVLKHARPDGTPALYDVPEYRARVDAAQRTAEARQKGRLKEATARDRMETSVDYREKLDKDPTWFGDPWEFVKKNASEFGPITYENADTFAGQIASRQRAVAEEQAAGTRYYSTDVRMYSNDPETKKYAQKLGEQIWSEVDTSDANSIRHGVTRLMAEYERTGIVWDGLAGLMKGANTAGISEDGVVDPAFTLAGEIFKSIREGNNPQLLLSILPEDNYKLLDMVSRHTEGGIQYAEAVKNAKRAATPEGRANVEQKFTKQYRDKVNAEVQNEFSRTWLIFGHDGKDISGIQQEARKYAEDHIAMGADPEKAVEAAVAHVQNMYHWDGHSNFFKMPLVSDRAQFERQSFPEAVKYYLEDVKKQYGDDDYQLVMSGDGKTYHVMSSVGHPTGETISASEIEDRWLQHTLNPVNLPETEKAIVDAIKNKTLTPEQATENFEIIRRLHGQRRINSHEFDRTTVLRQRAQMEADKKKYAPLKQGNVLPAGDVLSDSSKLDLSRPLPNPGGNNLRSIDLAKQYADRDPSFALTVAAEGLRLSTYTDPNGKDTNIGVGYNITSRKPEVVRKDFMRAGVPAEKVQAIIEGKARLTPEQAYQLFRQTKVEYEKMAEKAVGSEMWNAAPPAARAVMVDLAYATGNPAQFKKTIEKFREQDWAGVAAGLTLHYTDTRTGERKSDDRRVALQRATIAGDKVFRALLDESSKRQPKT